MPRRKTGVLIRKYLIIFFAILLIFIWMNHDSSKVEPDDGMVHFPSISVTPSNNEISIQAQHLLRVKNLKELSGRLIQDSLFKTNYKDPEEIVVVTEKPIKPARYYVNSPKCKMPYDDPFSQEALEIYSPFKLKLCSNESDVFVVTYDWRRKRYVLKAQESVLYRLNPHISTVCNFRKVFDDPNNLKEEEDERIYFSQSYELPKDLSGIIVECHDHKNRSRIVQQDAFSLIQVQNDTIESEADPATRKPSIILLGLDSLSRMNFQRTMPKTAKFVSQPGWFEMQGYNKVGDNTVQNLIPILMGVSVEKVPVYCTRYDKKCLQNYPWIWRDYKEAGYKVALAEDMSTRGIVFLQDSAGYYPGNVHHSLHSMLLDMEKVMATYVRYGYNYCIGRRHTISYVYDFCRQFVSRYLEERNQPVFGYFWSSTFTHDYNFAASSLDGQFVGYLKMLEDHQMFDKAIVVLFSDHGARFGELLDLTDSFLEERLPMLHIYLPPWFRIAYPKYAEALNLNRNRLSSNFDLYKTLRHIIQLSATSQVDLAATSSCPTSQSLLHPLPVNRGCDEACIGEHWCTCKEYITEPMTSEVYYIGKLLVYHINRWMLQHKYNEYCQRIRLFDLKSVEKRLMCESNGAQDIHGIISTYRVRFITLPYEASYQATVRFNRDLKRFIDINVPEISRLNSYHNHSLCVDNNLAKKFCFCYTSFNGTIDPYMAEWKKNKLNTPST